MKNFITINYKNILVCVCMYAIFFVILQQPCNRETVNNFDICSFFVFVLCVYTQIEGNCLLTSRIYVQNFLTRRHHSFRTFQRLAFEESGSWKSEGQRSATNEENLFHVLLNLLKKSAHKLEKKSDWHQQNQYWKDCHIIHHIQECTVVNGLLLMHLEKIRTFITTSSVFFSDDATFTKESSRQ